MKNAFKIARHVIKSYKLSDKIKWSTTSEGLENVIFKS